MEDIRNFIKKPESIDQKEIFDIIAKAKSIGFSDVLRENHELTSIIQNKLSEFELDEGIEFIKVYLPLLFDSIIEFVNLTEEIQEELKGIEDLSLTLKLKNNDFVITLIIENGKLDYKLDLIEECDLLLTMDKDSMKKFIAAEKDPLVIAYKGDVTAEGNLRIIIKLRKFFEIIKREFGIEVLGV